MYKLTPKQRDVLLKIIINASNAVMGGLVLGSVLGQSFRVKIFAIGMGLYMGLTVALLLDR